MLKLRAMLSTDLRGKNIVITGANTGIGRATARRLVARGAQIVVANRSRERSQESFTELQEQARAANAPAPQLVELDLGDFASVRSAAAQIVDMNLPIHVLINNAGVGGQRGITASGFELQFGVNHLGHFLFTQLLMPRLKEAAPSRVVIVASKVHTRVKKLDLTAMQQSTRSTSGFPEYAASKLANVLYARELARRLQGTGVSVYALHPGVIASDIWRRIPWPLRPLITTFMKSVDQGADTSLYCATDPSLAEHSGKYYMDCRQVQPSRLARDDQLAQALWEHSERWVQGDGASQLATAS